MNMIIQNKRAAFILLAVVVLLSVPLVAMLFTNEVNWSLPDFVVAAGLLLGAGFACEFVLRKVKTAKSRIMICATILAILVLFWAELAVGIFGTPLAGS